MLTTLKDRNTPDSLLAREDPLTGILDPENRMESVEPSGSTKSATGIGTNRGSFYTVDHNTQTDENTNFTTSVMGNDINATGESLCQRL